ncbi:MAG: DNA alkylation repair protein [Nitrososphaerales archaeon]|jgi:3-methyladenine DNA glycosylase AlkD
MVQSEQEVLKRLRSMSSPDAIKGMARFGINTEKSLGVSIPQLRSLAKETGRDHALAERLWSSGIHEARILATMVDDPKALTGRQMDRWVKDFDSWDVCDQCCSNLFDKTDLAYQKAVEWAEREEEFVKRAGFVLMAALAVHDRKEPDERFMGFLPIIEKHSTDERNFVKKAVNWALRQIGKRSVELNQRAIQTGVRIQLVDSSASKWIASDALRELRSEPVRRRLNSKRVLAKA